MIIEGDRCTTECDKGHKPIGDACVFCADPDGRVAELETSPWHCGACGNRCRTAALHADPACAAGACEITCEVGYERSDLGISLAARWGFEEDPPVQPTAGSSEPYAEHVDDLALIEAGQHGKALKIAEQWNQVHTNKQAAAWPLRIDALSVDAGFTVSMWANFGTGEPTGLGGLFVLRDSCVSSCASLAWLTLGTTTPGNTDEDLSFRLWTMRRREDLASEQIGIEFDHPRPAGWSHIAVTATPKDDKLSFELYINGHRATPRKYRNISDIEAPIAPSLGAPTLPVATGVSPHSLIVGRGIWNSWYDEVDEISFYERPLTKIELLQVGRTATSGLPSERLGCVLSAEP